MRGRGRNDDLRARLAALLALHNVCEGGRYLDEAFAAALRPYGDLSPSDRAFARLLVTTSLRRLGQIDSIINPFLADPKRPLPHRVRHALRLGAAQLLFLGTPPHAAVDTTVRLVAEDQAPEVRRLKGLVNAVMRRISREGAEIAAAEDAPRLNTPPWLWESWERRFGSRVTKDIAAAHLDEPPLDLTIRPGVDRDSLIREITEQGIAAEPSPSGGIRLRQAGVVEQLPGYDRGEWWVQDAAAALPARLMPIEAGQRVADLCAAPGGKTAQLAAAGARVTALDVSERRLELVRANLARLKLQAEVVAADAACFRPDQPFDHVLLDAPCMATGTLRRHPDGFVLKNRRDLASLVEGQRRLLDAAAEMVKPGGTLLYCVCSLEAEEGAEQIENFLSRRKDFARAAIAPDELPPAFGDAVTAAGDVQTLPFMAGGVDGFFIARLTRP